jgi:hypothetical protein
MREIAIVDAILRDRSKFFEEIRDGVALGKKIRAMFLASCAFLAIYGAVMGSSHSLPQALSSAVKLPILLLSTLVICSPTLYFFNILFGSTQSLQQTVAVLLTAVTVTAVLLLGFAPIVLFFLLTSDAYQFFKLLNVAAFAIAGVVGIAFLARGMEGITGSAKAGSVARRTVLRIWFVVYAFVGAQMGWTLRPFVGAPGLDFQVIRPMGGNVFTNIVAAVREVLGFQLPP